MAENIFTVDVNFKNNRDFSNNNKAIIVDALPGKYKESFKTLNDMNDTQVHSFEFPKKELADRFAKKLFSKHNKIFNIETSDPIDDNS